MKIKLRCLFLFFFGVVSLNNYAQDITSHKEDFSTKILFPIGKGELDLNYKNNKAALNSFIDKLKVILADSTYVVNELRVTGAASPDGKSEKRNIELAQQRIESMKKYILSNVKVTASVIKIENKGENWEALRAMMVASKMPYKMDALQIVDNIKDRNLRKNKLMFLHESVPYLYMYKYFFPILRNGIGGTFSNEALSAESINNWNLLRELVLTSDLEEKEALLDIINNTTDPNERLQKLKVFNGGGSYDKIVSQSLSKILYGADPQSLENWMLLEKNIALSDMDDKDEVLRIIRTVPLSLGREQQLKALKSGETYRLIQDKLFYNLLLSPVSENQNTTGVPFSYQLSSAARAAANPSVSIYNAVNADIETEKVNKTFIPYFAIKTNLFYWAGFTPDFECHNYIPNLELEYFFKHRWSLNVAGYYSSKDEKNADNEVRAFSGISAEPRFWFRNNNHFSGFYAGVYGLYGDFNVKQNSISTSGYTGTFYEGGISLGYYFHLFSRLGAELGGQAGYRSSDYDSYFMRNSHRYYQSSNTEGGFKLTGIRFSLTYRFGKVVNSRSNEK